MSIYTYINPSGCSIVYNLSFQGSIPLRGARELLSVGEKPERLLSGQLLRSD